MARGFVSLAVVVDWFSRRVLAWRLLITLEAAFCVEALEEALARHGRPQVFNTDQGSQFTSLAFTEVLTKAGIAISMDGRGSWRDNVFVERLWRTITYEEVDLRADNSVSAARASIGRYLAFYKGQRPHSALDRQTPDQASFTRPSPSAAAEPGRNPHIAAHKAVQTNQATSNIGREWALRPTRSKGNSAPGAFIPPCSKIALAESLTIQPKSPVRSAMGVPPINAAILFEPDGYLLSGDQLMGRQAAGNAFLRAAVAGRQEQPLWAYTPNRRSAEIFRKLVREMDPSAEARWLPADSFDLLTQLGTLYLPGPGLNAASRLRLRAGPVAYSLCGVTHTTATHNAMDQIAALLTAPVMPWDALICTSQAAVSTVKTVLEDESTYLRWRFESALCLTIPQLPVIPLGVHCTDFTFDQGERASARQNLRIAEDEVAILFVGRLSFHAKAHPHAMYVGLKAAAERTGKRPVLIQCGWFASDHIEQAFKTGAAQYAPDIRVLFTNGRDPDARRQTWAAGDLFISLSDNIQETFGLTPIEAMAAGLPTVVTDWDGYKDTVRDGVDGFRIPTFMPPKLGERFAQAYEAGTDNYDYYCGLVCQAVSVDIGVLADRLSDLIANVSLRQQMGEAGRQHARAVFDWTVVYRQYQQLWMELASIRLSAQRDSKQQKVLKAAPKVASSRADPFRSFGHYPTTLIQPTMRVTLVPGVTASQYRALAAHPLYSYASKSLPRPEIVEQLFARLGKEELIIQDLVRSLGLNLDAAVLVLAMLAKMGLVRFASTKADAPPYTEPR